MLIRASDDQNDPPDPTRAGREHDEVWRQSRDEDWQCQSERIAKQTKWLIEDPLGCGRTCARRYNPRWVLQDDESEPYNTRISTSRATTVARGISVNEVSALMVTQTRGVSSEVGITDFGWCIHDLVKRSDTNRNGVIDGYGEGPEWNKIQSYMDRINSYCSIPNE